MSSSFRDAKLRLRSKIADFLLPRFKGTLITGCVRSGTTLALRVYCPALSAEEEEDGSILNEYRPLSSQVIRGNVEKALLVLPLVMQNRFHLHKSPHIAFLLPFVNPKYQVIVTFRDLRLTVPSMLRHENVQRMVLSNRAYWLKYTDQRLPDDVVTRAIVAAEQYYLHALRYEGPIQVWNYGFWDEWVVRSERTGHLYERRGETSKGVLNDVQNGALFSNSAFNLDLWESFCRSNGVTDTQRQAIREANERIKQLYMERELTIKTLDDTP